MGSGELVVRVDGDRVHVAGELDFATAARLVDVVRPLVGGDVVVDLSGVAFCDSSGLNALVRLHKAAVAAGGGVRLVRVPEHVAAIMAVVSLDQIFALDDEER